MSIEAFERLDEEKRESILSAGIKEFSERSYRDASTDSITAKSGISKGLLFHYFGSKKEFYFYCLSKAMDRLTQKTENDGTASALANVKDNETDEATPKEEAAGNIRNLKFYHILFATMDQKMKLCMEYKDETHLVNMASRENAREVLEGKQKILMDYAIKNKSESMRTMQSALAALEFKNPGNPKVTEGLYLYIHAVMNKYLLLYQERPEGFFENAEQIKAEIQEYLQLMLEGICI